MSLVKIATIETKLEFYIILFFESNNFLEFSQKSPLFETKKFKFGFSDQQYNM